MPLVTLTCRRGFYPRDDFTGLTEPAAQAFVVKLAKALPSSIAQNAISLGLDPANTPEEGIQVDIKKFHHEAVNAPDIWIHVQFTEPCPRDGETEAIRDEFIELVANLFGDDRPQLTWATDLFWGPGRGVIVPADLDGTVIRW